jgi:hypothetical protein
MAIEDKKNLGWIVIFIMIFSILKNLFVLLYFGFINMRKKMKAMFSAEDEALDSPHTSDDNSDTIDSIPTEEIEEEVRKEEYEKEEFNERIRARQQERAFKAPPPMMMVQQPMMMMMPPVYPMVPDYTAGLIFGFTGHDHKAELEGCMTDSEVIAADAQKALQDILAGDFIKSMNAIGDLIWMLPDAVSSCTDPSLKTDIASIEAWAVIFKQPLKLSKTVTKNWLMHGEDIKKNIAKD